MTFATLEPRKRGRRLALASAVLFAASCSALLALHPLDPPDSSELGVVLNVLRAEGYWDDATRFPMMELAEPDKEFVLGWKPADPVPRRVFLVVKRGRDVFETVVDVGRRRVVSWRKIEGVQPGILLTDEWIGAQRTVRRHPGWRAAVETRGFEDYESVVLVPMTAGYFGDAAETERRLVKVVSYDGREVENYWGRPIEGLVAVVDLDAGEVVELQDPGAVPLPSAPVDFDEAAIGATRSGVSDLAVSQPGGPSYRLEDHWISWQGWRFHWRVDPRTGLTLSLVTFTEGDRAPRSVLYQGSLSEMFVPYTDPEPAWSFRAFMDAGEYGVGRLSSRLVPGLDCPAHAEFFDATFLDDWGNSYVARQVACLFERQPGEAVWRHHEGVSGRTHGRARTDLVLRQVATVGNYDYVLDWVFRQDGSIRVAVGASGVPAVKAAPRPRESGADATANLPYGRWVADRTVAVNHDHFFSFRLDLDVDGRRNSLLVDRPTAVDLPEGAPRTSTWMVRSDSPATEQDSRLRISLDHPALWRVANPGVEGPQGYPVSYRLRPGANAVSLLAADDPLQKRTGFTNYHLWATPYRPLERYAAGLYPNQSRGRRGLPAWTSEDRPVRDTDIVLWYTLGMHHVVRAEDWPVMPVTWSGFELLPFDFFARNPALDLPLADRPSE